MSFARGDLARRAALADNLAVPEPWGANDDPRVFAAIRDLRDEFRQLGITDADGRGRLPDFLIDYENLPPIKPTTLDRAHNRNSSATRWDQNGNLVEDSSDTLRLQRDPATQAVQGLLYEPKRTQGFNVSTDFSDSYWTQDNLSSVNSNVGTAKGQSYDELVENSGVGEHGISVIETQGSDNPVSTSFIVKKNTRDWVFIQFQTSNNEFPRYYFNLANGTTGSGTNNSIGHEINDLGGGWYRIKVSVKPPSGEQFTSNRLRMATQDAERTYTGDGSSSVFVMHGQTEISREVTTPILTGDATRGADAVDYRFDFPDKTTGVAFSALQSSGGGVGGLLIGPRMGITPENFDSRHGVFMYDAGILGDNADKHFTITRNTNKDLSSIGPVENQTIDRFEVRQRGKSFSDRFIFRQIAIHRQPHTQAQKDTLREQYLTQP